ncbi:MAG: hypothetical protein V3V04_07645 [Rhizobiaceae bacterium]
MLSTLPLMAIVLIIYNGLLFGLGGAGMTWDYELFSINMVSGSVWSFDLGDFIIVLGLLLLFFEILKSTRVGRLSIIDHLLSTLVLIIFLVEFLLIPGASTSIFFILMLMALMDVMAGFSVSIRSATRDVNFGNGSL